MLTTETAPKDVEKEKAVEITVEAVKPEPAATPTREELKSQGWSAKELEAAEKRGMLGTGDKTPPDKKPPVVEDKKPPVVEDKKPPVVEDRKISNGGLPDFTITPEQEKVFTDTFGAGTPVRAIYFRMKNERHARQAAEALARETQAKLEVLQAQLTKVAAPVVEVETDADGNVVDPEEKPLTLKQLKQLQQAEAAAIEQKQKDQVQRNQAVSVAQKEQEDFARSVLPDFDHAIEKAKEVMQNLETYFPEKWKQSKVVQMIRDLQIAAAQADKIGLDEYNAAMIAYELGQMHPEYGKKAPVKSSDNTGVPMDEGKDPKANGRLTPEQMKRIEANTQRRGSSASIPDGGGKKIISVDDVDLATLSKMNFAERDAFRKKFPERYAKLLRG